MSYESVENSEYAGSETFFYVIVGPNYEYRWTNAPKTLTVTIDGQSYDFKHPRGGISHKSAVESKDAERTGREIIVSHRNPVIRRHREFPPPGDTEVTIYRQNEVGGTPDFWWSGTLIETPIEGSKGILYCQHIIELVHGSEGLTDRFGPKCGHMFTQFPCPVLIANATDPGLVVEDVDAENLQVTVSGSIRIAGKYKLGVIVAPNGDKRSIFDDIVDSGNHVFTLLQNFPASTLRVGDLVDVIRGCDRLPQTCRDEWGAHTGNGVAHSATNIHANKNPHEIGRLE